MRCLKGDHLARVIEMAQAMIANGGRINHNAIKAETGLGVRTISRWLRDAAVEGDLGFDPVLPGFGVKQSSVQKDEAGAVQKSWVKQTKLGEQFAVPKGHGVKGVSALLDPHGAVLAKWVKTHDLPSVQDVAEYLKTAFADFPPREIQPAPARGFEDTLTLYPLPDLHIGMFAWGKETEQQDWDLRIAEKAVAGACLNLIERAPASKTAVILGGGDQLHADSNENRTAKSGNALQVDGRYAKVLGTACRLFARVVDAALAKHETVEVRILQGNHDENASVAIGYFLLAWYRNEPRVQVDVSPSLYWWRRFGKVLLGATHGHKAKPAQMPAIMAERRYEDWGQTRFRFAHTFHVHHAGVLEAGGVIVETHQSPAAQDAYHSGEGFLSGRSLCAITYDERCGEVCRSRVVITT